MLCADKEKADVQIHENYRNILLPFLNGKWHR